jgi:hypothetical protein
MIYHEFKQLDSRVLNSQGNAMDIDSMTLEHALTALGELLSDRGCYYEIVAIGGGSLLLLDQIDRTTKDLDLVALIEANRFISADPLPQELAQAVSEVGLALDLGKDWLNAGPASLLEMGLPDGFATRMQTRNYAGLTIHLAGRLDQICFKLYAAVDQGPHSKHFADLKHLEPSEDDLQVAKCWCVTHDVSDAFESELKSLLTAIGVSNEDS